MAIYAYLDVQKEETITAAIAYAVETWGRIDGAINNAGAQQGAAHDTHDFPEDEWTPIIDIDLTGVDRCMKAELAGLRTVGAGAVAYHSAKAGARHPRLESSSAGSLGGCVEDVRGQAQLPLGAFHR